MTEERECECGCGEKFRALRGQRFVDKSHEISVADLVIPPQGDDDLWDGDRGWYAWPSNDL